MNIFISNVIILVRINFVIICLYTIIICYPNTVYSTVCICWAARVYPAAYRQLFPDFFYQPLVFFFETKWCIPCIARRLPLCIVRIHIYIFYTNKKINVYMIKVYKELHKCTYTLHTYIGIIFVYGKCGYNYIHMLCTYIYIYTYIQYKCAFIYCM